MSQVYNYDDAAINDHYAVITILLTLKLINDDLL